MWSSGSPVPSYILAFVGILCPGDENSMILLVKRHFKTSLNGLLRSSSFAAAFPLSFFLLTSSISSLVSSLKSRRMGLIRSWLLGSFRSSSRADKCPSMRLLLGMAAPNCPIPLSGGVSTWGTRSRESQVDGVRPEYSYGLTVISNYSDNKGKGMSNDVDLLYPSAELEKKTHKLKRLVQSPNSFFMDVRTTIFSHSQTVVTCATCPNVLCQPTGGRARIPEGCSFRVKKD
ncbi:40S ribosomal protein S27-2 [Tanacetum coccineum]|uniref:40S ribosomal protein S27-2 n=1 Tax=Tanacetum coccineum TaxID=301880 RepID=A0ABQ5EKJ2_9ASTR